VDTSTAFAALSATTGTIAAYVHYLATIAAWAGRHGVEPTQADHYVRGVFAGVSYTLSDRTRTLSELAVDHETRGGLNEQLRRAWFNGSNAAALDLALDSLLERITRPRRR
jgi:pyrroline-5-carboxylate reductase